MKQYQNEALLEEANKQGVPKMKNGDDDHQDTETDHEQGTADLLLSDVGESQELGHVIRMSDSESSSDDEQNYLLPNRTEMFNESY